jgi:hypothetical protein
LLRESEMFDVCGFQTVHSKLREIEHKQVASRSGCSACLSSLCQKGDFRMSEGLYWARFKRKLIIIDSTVRPRDNDEAVKVW